MEETGFGVLEDKVVKNYIATEFLYDYLKDKRSVGVIEEDRERSIQYVAEPIGVVLALLPITNPTSTALFKSIVGGEDPQRDDLPALGARRALRDARGRDPAGGRRGGGDARRRAPGDPRPDPRRLPVPLPPPRRRPDLDDRRARRRSPRRTRPASRCISVGAGNAPVYVHRSADIADGGDRHPDLEDLRRVGDLPRGADLRRRRRDLRRARRRVRAHGRAAAHPGAGRGARRGGLRRRRATELAALGQSCVNLGAMAGIEVRRRTTRCCWRRLPSDLEELADASVPPGEADAGARPRALAVGRARDRRLRARHRERRARPHLGRLRPRRGGRRPLLDRGSHRADPRQRADRGRRAGRRSTTR